jgi:DNA-binding ferritin-like protein
MYNYFKNTLAVLKAARDHYRSAHWNVKGDSFYGDHLLYERLYEDVEEEIDSFAEKMIGICGPIHDYGENARKVSSISQKWAVIDCPHRRSLKVEKTVTRFLEKLHAKLEETDQITLGLGDMITGIADKHEEHLYLIKQRLRKEN